MIGKIVVLCLLIALIAILLLRVKVQVEYGHPALAVWVRIGVWRIPIVPKQKKKSAKKSKGTKVKAASKRDTVETLRAFLPLVLRTVKRLFRTLQVDKLELVLTAGAEDPGDAALQYGRANAVLGALWQPMVTICHVVDGRARVDIDFDAKKTQAYLFVGLSLRIGQILVLAVVFAVQALGILLNRAKKTTPN